MKRFLSCVMLGSLLATNIVHAQDVVLPPVPVMELNEPNVGEAISPLKLGQKAPFTGILFSPAAAAKINTELKNVPEQINIEIDRVNKICNAECQFKLNNVTIERRTDQQIASARLSSAVSENELLVNRIKKLENSQSNVLWWTIGGFAGGALVTVLVVVSTSLGY